MRTATFDLKIVIDADVVETQSVETVVAAMRPHFESVATKAVMDAKGIEPRTGWGGSADCSYRPKGGE